MPAVSLGAQGPSVQTLINMGARYVPCMRPNDVLAAAFNSTPGVTCPPGGTVPDGHLCAPPTQRAAASHTRSRRVGCPVTPVCRDVERMLLQLFRGALQHGRLSDGRAEPVVALHPAALPARRRCRPGDHGGVPGAHPSPHPHPAERGSDASAGPQLITKRNQSQATAIPLPLSCPGLEGCAD